MKPDTIDRAISELETGIDKLQALYNQYFMGIEKLQPAVMHKTVERNIQLLRKTQIQNTAQKFRLQTLFQRFNTLNNHWQRVCREIEEGTYRRHIDKAKRRQEIKRRTEAPEDPLGLPAQNAEDDTAAYDLSSEFGDTTSGNDQASFDMSDLGGMDLDEPFNQVAGDVKETKEGIGTLDDPFGEAIWPATPSQNTQTQNRKNEPVPQGTSPRSVESSKKSQTNPSKNAPPSKNRPPETRPRPPKPVNAPPMQAQLDARRAHAIFRTFVAARSRCNERTDNLTLDKVTKSLKKQYDANGGEIDFKVVIKNGRAAIKTVPKKKSNS